MIDDLTAQLEDFQIQDLVNYLQININIIHKRNFMHEVPVYIITF